MSPTSAYDIANVEYVIEQNRGADSANELLSPNDEVKGREANEDALLYAAIKKKRQSRHDLKHQGRRAGSAPGKRRQRRSSRKSRSTHTAGHLQGFVAE